jgi:hypothetical protein
LPDFRDVFGIIDPSVYGITSQRGRPCRRGGHRERETLDLTLRAHPLPASRLRAPFPAVCGAIETTSTFKHRKSDLVRDGLNQRHVGHDYFNDTGRRALRYLTERYLNAS